MKYIGMPLGLWLLFKKSFQRQMVTTLGIDEDTAARVTAQAKVKYKEIIANLPEFEKGDQFKLNLVDCAMFSAFYLNLPKKPSLETMTEFYDKATMTSAVKWFCRMSGKSKFTDKDIQSMNTGYIDDHVSCVREFVANIFFYTRSSVTIMIDAGYNYDRLEEKMDWLGIDPTAIRHILITHQDTDHVGAVERDSPGLFRDATLYIGEIENRYLTGKKRRRVIHGFYKLPQVYIDNPKVLLKDGQILDIEGIKIECFLVPGHTWGHMVYLIDNTYLFTGDTLWFGPDGGKSFINMLAESNKVAVQSLTALENRLRQRRLRPVIITGHTGWTDDLDFAFANKDKICNAYVRQKPHDPEAPYDAYDESDDTEEKARDGYLSKVRKLP